MQEKEPHKQKEYHGDSPEGWVRTWAHRETKTGQCTWHEGKLPVHNYEGWRGNLDFIQYQ